MTDVSTPPLQACRTCVHGRELYEQLKIIKGGIKAATCMESHNPAFRFPKHEYDDQHGFHRHCADWQCRPEVIDGDKEDAQ